MIENGSQLIPHRIEECIQLLWSVDLYMCDVLGWSCDVEEFGLLLAQKGHNRGEK